jgi:histidinol phosphatase-like PHP family hydrolase
MPIRNAEVAELLAIEAETAKQPAQRALRRASRRAFLWEEEAEDIVSQSRALTELSGVGPYISKLIQRWVECPPAIADPPEIRRHFLSWTEAVRVLKVKPEWARQLKGDLQMHTLWSDGGDSVEAMANEAASLGYEFIGVTDHSKGLKIAGGIDERQLLRQRKEIDAVNQRFRVNGQSVTVLHSLEVNLSPSGEVDMEPSALDQLDIVLGCFHSALRRKDDQTDRYLAALNNPSIQILGHPKGRIYNFRLGLQADWRRVFDCAANLDKAVEIDAYPDRQDLNLELLRTAKISGCRISFGTDAHGSSQLRFMVFALAASAIAEIPAERVVNFMNRDQLLNWVANVREKNPRLKRGA